MTCFMIPINPRPNTQDSSTEPTVTPIPNPEEKEPTSTPIINPEDLIGHTFLIDKQEDGQQLRAHSFKLIDDHTPS